ncbi:hypothetical protein EV121DRAFT_297272 [Schizophyllum commune]
MHVKKLFYNTLKSRRDADSISTPARSPTRSNWADDIFHIPKTGRHAHPSRAGSPTRALCWNSTVPDSDTEEGAGLRPVKAGSYANNFDDDDRTVTGYCKRAFQIHRCPARSMSEDDVVRSRLLQYHTNAVISGSVAVQFFSRESFADGDLDLYNERQRAFTIFHILLGMGYAFLPRKMQVRTLEDALTQAVNEDMVPDDLH